MTMTKFQNDANEFLKAVYTGYGWIATSDVLRQFFGEYPEYESNIYDRIFIEYYLVKMFKEKNMLKDVVTENGDI